MHNALPYRPHVARAYARLFRPLVPCGRCRARLDHMTARLWTHLDVAVYRHLGLSLGVKALGVDDVLLLRTRGRTTGQVREVLVAYVDIGGAPVVCAANAGWDHQPGWFQNLRGGGPVEVQCHGECHAVTPVLLEGDERERALAAMEEAFPYMRLYLARTARRFPVLRLQSAVGPTY